MSTIITERLEAFNKGLITLDASSHRSFEDGHCSMEVVAWLAGEGHTDAPECASPVLTRYTIRLNDRWGAEQRQTLAPFLPRMVGTGGDGLDEERQRIATRYLVEKLLGPWLRLAGMHEDADLLATFISLPVAELIVKLREIRDRARAKRTENQEELRKKVEAKVREGYVKKPVAVAAAAAAAVADADAAAVAAAAAAAVAVAAAAAAAVADAAAAAVADAVAAAVADAAAAAAAVAAAAADAAAAAAAAAAADAPYGTWGTSYSAAYSAARTYYREHPEIFEHIHALNKEQQPYALELLELMIKPEASNV